MSRFCIRRRGESYSSPGYVLETELNLFIGEKEFKKNFKSISSLEGDLLLLGAAVLAADRGTERGLNENVSRNIVVDIPVVNIGRLLPAIKSVEAILRHLSNDGWEIKLRAAGGVLEEKFELPTKCGRTLLFSGGLDSLAAAVEFGQTKDILGLVSHKTRNSVTDSAQQDLAALLKGSGYNIDHQQYFVSSRDGGPNTFIHDVENSQRTRSFVFLVLGALVARRTGRYDLMYLAENGQMAIHLPLNQGRVGAFSTHTAHPDVLVGMESFLQNVLLAPIRIVNPYVEKTKKEVIEIVLQKLPSAIPISTSCWRNARLTGKARHCGECIPCYVRRIAIEALTKDPTKYARDPWTQKLAALDENDDGLRNLVDLIEFARRFESSADAELMSGFPELHSQNINAPGVIGMYRRFASEARKVLSKYPTLGTLLK